MTVNSVLSQTSRQSGGRCVGGPVCRHVFHLLALSVVGLLASAALISGAGASPGTPADIAGLVGKADIDGPRIARADTFADTLGDTLRVREGYRLADPHPAGSPGAGDAASSGRTARHHAAWVDSLRVRLFGDRDHDGYYRGFRLDIDVDTDAASADVYAVLYLQLDGRPLRALHTTASFLVRGNRSSDEYTVEIELLDNYRAGSYDIAIDIVDAGSGRLLDGVSSSQFSNLGGLPLEAPDGGAYGYYDDDPPYHDDDYVAVSYTGSAGRLLLLGMLLTALRRRILASRHPRSTACRDTTRPTPPRSTRRPRSG